MDVQEEPGDPARLAFHRRLIAEEQAAAAICDRVLHGPARWWRNALLQKESARTAGMVAILVRRCAATMAEVGRMTTVSGRFAVAVLFAATLLSCHKGVGRQVSSRFVAYPPAELMSEYRSVPLTGGTTALLHVLFVPAVDVPSNVAYGSSAGSGGTDERRELNFSCSDSTGRTITAQPVTVHEKRTVAAGNRSFELAHGNVFVAEVSRGGAVTLSQLKITRNDPNESSDSILREIQTALPQNQRIQSLKRGA